MERSQRGSDPASTGEATEYSLEESNDTSNEGSRQMQEIHLENTFTGAEIEHENVPPDINDLENFVGVADFEEQIPIDEENVKLPSYRDYVVGSPAYELLLSRINRNMTTTTASPNVMESISGHIIRDLSRNDGARSISRNQGPHICNVGFIINWLPLEFLKNQDYGMTPEEAFGKVITLTGTDTNAQALTTEQYMQQTWPFTGDIILEALKDAFRQGPEVGSSSRRRRKFVV